MTTGRLSGFPTASNPFSDMSYKWMTISATDHNPWSGFYPTTCTLVTELEPGEVMLRLTFNANKRGLKLHGFTLLCSVPLPDNPYVDLAKLARQYNPWPALLDPLSENAIQDQTQVASSGTLPA